MFVRACEVPSALLVSNETYANVIDFKYIQTFKDAFSLSLSLLMLFPKTCTDETGPIGRAASLLPLRLLLTLNEPNLT